MEEGVERWRGPALEATQGSSTGGSSKHERQLWDHALEATPTQRHRDTGTQRHRDTDALDTETPVKETQIHTAFQCVVW